MAYERVGWEDSPSTNTPINATNLNIMDVGIKAVSDATDITTTNPPSQTSYYPTFVGDTKNQRTNDGLRYDTQEGTSSTVGRATLVLGNGIANGTAGNKQGRLALHNSSTGYTWLQTAASSSAITQTLPALTGTVCVKQGATITTETNGWYKVDMGAFTLYFKNGQIPSQSYNSNGWDWLSGDWRKLPTGISFNSSKMVFSGNVQGGDAAITYGYGIGNGSTNVNIYYNNKYNGVLTAVGYYNFMLIDFS